MRGHFTFSLKKNHPCCPCRRHSYTPCFLLPRYFFTANQSTNKLDCLDCDILVVCVCDIVVFDTLSLISLVVWKPRRLLITRHKVVWCDKPVGSECTKSSVQQKVFLKGLTILTIFQYSLCRSIMLLVYRSNVKKNNNHYFKYYRYFSHALYEIQCPLKSLPTVKISPVFKLYVLKRLNQLADFGHVYFSILSSCSSG